MMIITDRKQLDKQIIENFEKTGYPNQTIRAKSSKLSTLDNQIQLTTYQLQSKILSDLLHF